MARDPRAVEALPTPELHPPSEAEATLLGMAEGRTGRVPARLLVRQALLAAGEGGWPVQRAAWEAIHRRIVAARADRLGVTAAPPRPLGPYTTRRGRSHERPYRTVLDSVEPLRGSCDCPDFLRNSLGVCKHLLVVLEHLSARPRLWRAAFRPADGRGPDALRLLWDPLRPLTGAGDWLDRVSLAGQDGDGATPGLLPWFGPAAGGLRPLRQTAPGEPRRRLALVEALLPVAEWPGRGRRASRPGSPALAALLAAERLRLQRLIAGDAPRRAFRHALGTLRRRLYPYQSEGVLRFLSAGSLLLADDMGLGKTAQAVASCHVLHAAGLVRRGLVIAPASLKEQWRREWLLFTSTPVTIVEGPPGERKRLYRSHERGFLIANYEQVVRDVEELRRWQPDIVVLDEAQRIKNWATKTAGSVKLLRPPYRLVLTGTPMENRLEELASIMDWVDDLAIEPKWRLQPWHAQQADGRREVVGARNLDTLRERLSGSLLRRLRRDVLAQLPPRTDTVVPVELTEAQAGRHAEIDLPIARLLARAKKRPLTQAEFLKLMTLLTMQRIVADGLALADFEEVWPGLSGVDRPGRDLLASLSTPKLAELREILAQVVVGQGRKAVVFSQWRRMLLLAHWAVRDLLADAGLRAAFFTGEESLRRRTQNVVDFHDDPATAVLFATDAGGVGLNLQRAASCCVNLDLPWNPAVLEQRVGRIHRHGQRGPVDVYDLVTEDCIESRIAGIVSGKKALFEGLFDGTSDEVRFEGAASFLSRLERVVEPAVLRAAQAGPAEEAPDDLPVEEEEPGGVEGPAAAEALVRPEAPGGAGAPAGPAATGPKAAAGPSAPGDVTAPPATAAAPMPPGIDLAPLLGQLRVVPRQDGGLSIEAPPAAASALASLLEGLAKALRSGPGRS